nr:MAG TPA: hypothetical protein [Caudoviricetes sp.]
MNRNITPQTEYITVDSSCTLFSPIYTHGKDSEVMDIRTVRAINTHNELWDRICSKQ